jgi:hypothetical protein
MWEIRRYRISRISSINFTLIIVVVAVTVATVKVDAQNTDLYPNSRIRVYDDISWGSNKDDPGSLSISETYASFSGLKGSMVLRYAGMLPDFGDTQASGARVYRIVNADQYYRENKWPNGLCDREVKWVGVRVFPPAPPGYELPKKSVRFTALVGDDFKSLDPNSVCTGAMYQLRSE